MLGHWKPLIEPALMLTVAFATAVAARAQMAKYQKSWKRIIECEDGYGYGNNGIGTETHFVSSYLRATRVVQL